MKGYDAVGNAWWRSIDQNVPSINDTETLTVCGTIGGTGWCWCWCWSVVSHRRRQTGVRGKKSQCSEIVQRPGKEKGRTRNSSLSLPVSSILLLVKSVWVYRVLDDWTFQFVLCPLPRYFRTWHLTSKPKITCHLFVHKLHTSCLRKAGKYVVIHTGH